MTSAGRGSDRLLAILLLGALVASTAIRTTSDWDTFWHLRVGHEALVGHTTLPIDPFSFSAHGAPWRYKDLVGDVLLYAGFAWLGYAWFAILKGLCALVIGLATWMSARRRPLLGVGVAALLLLVVDFRIAERPLLFTLACAPLLFALLERARRQRGALVPAVLLVWCWAQLHREALVGIVLLFGYAQDRLLARLLGERLSWLWARVPPLREVLWAQVAWLLALGLGLWNASGIHLYTSSLTVVQSSMLKEAILEWQPIAPGVLAQMMPAAAVLCLGAAVLGVASMLSAWRRRVVGPLDAWHLGCWALFLERTLASVRWLPYLAFVSALIVLLVLAEWIDGMKKDAPRGLGLLCALSLVVLQARLHRESLGVGEAPHHYPSAALRYARAQHLHERVANALPFGGYLIWYGWPHFLVAVDGRNDLVYSPEYMLACRDSERDAAAFARMRAVDGADWVLAGNAPQTRSHAFLSDDPAWGLVLYSEPASIYVRRDAYPALVPYVYAPLLARDVAPAAVAKRAHEAGDEDRLVRELERLIADAPDDAGPYIWAARAYDALGPAYAERRDEAVRRLVRINPDYARAAAE